MKTEKILIDDIEFELPIEIREDYFEVNTMLEDTIDLSKIVEKISDLSGDLDE